MYIFCRRAWWYHLDGYQPANQEQLGAGMHLHSRNARTLAASLKTRLLAYILLILGVSLAIVHLASPYF